MVCFFYFLITNIDFDRGFRCFICNLEKTEFSKKGINFAAHRTEEHNEWDYVCYLVHLHEINANDQNGIESFIFEKVVESEELDISWVPIGQALSLK